MAHTFCMLDKQGYMHAGAHAHAPGNMHELAHARTQICNTYCFSTATMIRERASMLRYTYIVRLFFKRFIGFHPRSWFFVLLNFGFPVYHVSYYGLLFIFAPCKM